jgi:cell division protease FtsH
VTWFLPKEDEYTTSKTKFLDQICGLLGGRAAEEVIFGEITTGASNDIEKASAIARNMATRYGMDDDLGMVAYGERQGSMFLGVDVGMSRNYSEDVAKKIDAFVKDVIAQQYKRARSFVQEHRKKMDELAELLLKVEALSAEEFAEIFDGGKRRRVKKARREGKETPEE